MYETWHVTWPTFSSSLVLLWACQGSDLSMDKVIGLLCSSHGALQESEAIGLKFLDLLFYLYLAEFGLSYSRKEYSGLDLFIPLSIFVVLLQLVLHKSDMPVH